MNEPIAIVGMACRYPDAADPEQLWQTVMAGRRAFRPLPAERLPLADYGGDGLDQTYVTHAGLLTGWRFDRQRFRVAGPAFRAADTTHWLALEVSAAALADAGFPDGEGLDRGRTGVVLGNSLTGEFSRAATLRTRWPYVRRTVHAALAGSSLDPAERAEILHAVEARYKEPFPEPSDESLAGALSNTIAGRICNHFDFRGAGYTVDGACASSLLAVSHAATALGDGQLEVALAGGVDLSLDPFELVGFARAGALARGEMRVYDRRPTGFLPGEGCGVVVLCRDSFARRHGLRTYARLLGWGVSADGNGGLIRPEPAGQRLALLRAYERAGLDPGEVRLVEGHGTGTAVGDVAELRALLEVRGTQPASAALGSIKANIGHTKAAAGVAGLLKAAYAVHRGVLPPTTGCTDPHPLLTEPGGTLEILREARAWPAGERYASVSAMGFGGVNAHLVLGGVRDAAGRLGDGDRRLARRPPGHEVIVCTAADRRALAERLARLRDAAGHMSGAELGDLAAGLAHAETGDAAVRFAAAVASPAELAAAAQHVLDELAGGATAVIDPDRRVFLADRDLRVALLLPGQASPCYPDAGALGDLLEELPPGYADPLPLPAGAHTVTGTAVAQPAILRSTLAGLRWLEALGVSAQAAAGHSLGELAALVWAGYLNEEEAYRLARTRGAAMADADPEGGAMANLETDPDTAAALLADSAVVVAAENGDRQIVVSGDRAEVAGVLERAAAAGIRATWLPVAHAFHSPAMTPAAHRLKAAAAEVAWRPARRPYVSTVTGDWFAGDDPVELLVRQLTSPVRFRAALAVCRADLFVEAGPGRVLTGMAGGPAVALDAGSPSARGVATVTAALFAAGRCRSVLPYYARRFTRPFDPDEAPGYLSNPCERAVPDIADEIPPAFQAPPALPAPPPSTDPLAAAVAAVAEMLELDPGAVPSEARLLADLHLSSLAVGRLAATVATALGRVLPAAPLSLATATVAELAEVVAALPAAGDAEAPAAGVAGWVRAFAPRSLPAPDGDAPAVARAWEIIGDLTAHPLAQEIGKAFVDEPGGVRTRLLALPPDLNATAAPELVAALRSGVDDDAPMVVLHHAGVGAAIGRSIVAERPGTPVLVIETPADADGITRAAAEAARPLRGYAETVIEPGGTRTVPALAPLAVTGDAPIPLGPGDVCVVTGGAKGIGAECAVALAAATGAHMVLLGRSPATDEAARATLARVSATGAPASYRAADVTDAAALAATLAEVRRTYGPVRAIVHAAGHNAPAPIAGLTATAMNEALAPKVAGLDHLLSAVDLPKLRLAVAFGSLIARIGLPGEAHYAVANEWLARRFARLAVAVPGVRWLAVEWSAWSEAGMGVRLGVLDALLRQGLSPIPSAAGTDLLLRLLATPELPPVVVVTGRLPATPTLRWHDERGELRGRFVADPLAHTPGVEFVGAGALSLGDDPYLADHRIDGALVLPAVLGLEAMAQAGAAVRGETARPEFTGVALTQPVTAPERDRRGLRVAALLREDGKADVVLRSDETGFAADHFAARLGTAPPAGPAVTPALPDGPLLPARDLYGPVFFHGPRFQRVAGYRAIAARRCVAVVDADPDGRWFSDFLDGRLALGDPGARDAFLHLLQVCVPDRRVLPVGVDRIRAYRRPEGRLTVRAGQRSESDREFVFDVLVTDAAGVPVEEWTGLTLRAVQPMAPSPWPLDVVGAWMARVISRSRPSWGVDLAVAPDDRRVPGRSVRVAGWLAGAPVTRTPDGRLTTGAPGGVSASHLGDRLLVAAAPGPVGVDWEADGPGQPALGPADAALAARYGPVRVWTCREVLRKLGQPPDAPLLAGGPDTLVSGPYTLVSSTVATTAGAVAVCVGARS